MSIRTIVAAALGLSAIHMAQSAAIAQEYPTRPITLIMGLGAGGSTEFVARSYVEIVSRSIGQRVLLENRPGAAGIIAASAVARAAPDGYTLLFVLNTVHQTVPAMQDLPFDPIKDFSFITPLVFFTTYAIAPADRPVNSLRDLVAYSKQKPEGLNFGTFLGSTSDIMGRLFKVKTGAALEAVQYRGPSDLQTDLLAGRIDFAFSTSSSFRAAYDDKKIKILAANAEARSPNFPDVSTLAEQGYADVSVPTWFGLAAPAGTPAAIINKLHAEFTKAARDADFVQRAAQQDLVLRSMSPDDFRKMIVADKERLEPLVKSLGMKLN